MTQTEAVLDRRRFLQAGILGGALLAADALFARRASAVPRYGPVGPVDANGLQLPPGFTSRIVARSNVVVSGTTYKWHRAPDGGRVFAAPDGWVYVSNCELANGAGGVGMLRFNQAGAITDARRILNGTNRNCSGGHTPWGTWLSCEETDNGRVWEVDPLGSRAGGHPSRHGPLQPRGCRRRRREPDRVPDRGRAERPLLPVPLRAGPEPLLRACSRRRRCRTESSPGCRCPIPRRRTKPTRKQVPNATRFAGGEGIWLSGGVVNFTTKQDDRVWAYDIASSDVSRWSTTGPRTRTPCSVESTTSPCGTTVTSSCARTRACSTSRRIPKICLLEPSGEVSVFCRAVGHRESELTGIAFTPSGDRMYFSSQRGTVGTVGGGITFEVTGPFAG